MSQSGDRSTTEEDSSIDHTSSNPRGSTSSDQTMHESERQRQVEAGTLGPSDMDWTSKLDIHWVPIRSFERSLLRRTKDSLKEDEYESLKCGEPDRYD